MPAAGEEIFEFRAGLTATFSRGNGTQIHVIFNSGGTEAPLHPGALLTKRTTMAGFLTCPPTMRAQTYYVVRLYVRKRTSLDQPGARRAEPVAGLIQK